jgi:hypothetical protein
MTFALCFYSHGCDKIIGDAESVTFLGLALSLTLSLILETHAEV